MLAIQGKQWSDQTTGTQSDWVIELLGPTVIELLGPTVIELLGPTVIELLGPTVISERYQCDWVINYCGSQRD